MNRQQQMRTRIGFTIIEVLVSISIIGLLIAITLPAIQRVRATNRQLQCRNNLKQFGIALANALQVSGKFPTSRIHEPAMWRLLPYLDQAALYQAFRSGQDQPPFAVPTFVCPDDPLNSPSDNLGNSNYYFNDGTTFRLYDPTNGFRKDARHDVSPSEFTDGLSNTAAMSERLVGVPTFLDPTEEEMRSDPGRYLWYTGTRYSGRGQEALAVAECRNNRVTPWPGFRGSYMGRYREDNLGYDHLLGPNEEACYNGPEDINMEPGVFLFPPSSHHQGGVSLLLADGSVRFVTNSIDYNTWKALGSRNGNETIGQF